MENGTYIHLNDDWSYSPVFLEEMIQINYREEGMTKVRIPHTNVETPYHYFDEEIYQFISCYRKTLFAEEAWGGKHVLLTFEAVAHIAEVFINGKKAAEHFGGYTAFTVDIGDYLIFGKENIIVVKVDSRECNNLPPFGNVVDYMTFGGIYREVSIEIKDSVYIEDAYVITKDVEKEEKTLECMVTLCGPIKDNYKLKYELVDSNNTVLLSDCTDLFNNRIRLNHKISKLRNWDINNPVLYKLTLSLFEGDRHIDMKSVRVGFRSCIFTADGFYLNGEKIKLIGLNRHQSYPYVGYAMPERIQKQDADILKCELGVNAVRTSHYPQSQHFINRCDELGLLVFTEIPGWQHIGNQEWKEIACQNVNEMVMQYRNHPSIILWGVRINESLDDDEFYKRTNQIAHELDESRQTGGVRFVRQSNLLEDVYTYNDFLHNGKAKVLKAKSEVVRDMGVPYLISEFNGHMYPTKAFDDESHRLEHAMRHIRVLDAMFGDAQIIGAFGWCMFDYNTHKDFGSGDRICYHGVMDLFRNPKIAAAAYASQQEDVPVCVVSTGMNLGDHPGGNIGEVYVFSNADSIRLYKNERFVHEFYPNRELFPNMPHPPFLINDFIGKSMEREEKLSSKAAETLKEFFMAVSKYGIFMPLTQKAKLTIMLLQENITFEEGMRLYNKYIANWGASIQSYRFEAVKDGCIVKEVRKQPVKLVTLKLQPDSLVLQEQGTYDVAGVRISAVDEFGNRLPYYQEALLLETEGAIELIGPKAISLKGGAFGTYVKTKGMPGVGTLRIYNGDLGIHELTFQVL